ncbi:MAG: AsmA family protein [Micropepsaceae bacterium]
MRFWKIAGFTALGLAVAAGALVLFAPVSGFKGPIEARVTAATGHAFHIEGPVSLTFTPELALDLGAITLGAGQGPDAAPLVTARRAVVAVAFLPLLQGEAQPTSMTLEGADILIPGDGAAWRFKTENGEAPFSPFDAFAIGDLRLIDSRLTVGGVVIAAADVRLRWPRDGQSLSISGDIGFRERRFAIDTVIERRDALVQGGRVPLRVEFSSDLAEGSLDGIADIATLGFEGGVSVSAPSTRAFAAFLGAAIPGDRAFGELSLSAAVKASPGILRLREGRFALGGMTGAGNLSVSLQNTRPDFTGEVSVDRFVLGDYVSFTPLESGVGWQDTAFDLSGLTGFDADIRLKARSADLAGLAIQNLAFTLTGRAGGYRLQIDQALAYAAMLNATLNIEMGSGVPKLGLTLSAEGIDAQSAFAAAFAGEGLTGRANVKLDLTATGTTRLDLIRSLWGSVNLVLIDGGLDGIDPAELARTAADETGPAGIGGDAAVAFKRLSGAFDLRAGVAHSTSLRLVTNHMKLDAAGSFDLPNRTLDIHAMPQFTGDVVGVRDPANEGRLAVPFALSGGWAAPSAAPDWDMLYAALQSGRVALEAIELLPEPARTRFRDYVAKGGPNPPAASPPQP